MARLDAADPKKSLYLGKLTIVRVNPKEAVGLFESKGVKEKPKAGDEVFSKLSK